MAEQKLIYAEAHLNALLDLLKNKGFSNQDLAEVRDLFSEDENHLASVQQTREEQGRATNLGMDARLRRQYPTLKAHIRREVARVVTDHQITRAVRFETRWGTMTERFK